MQWARELDLRERYRSWSEENLDLLCKTVAAMLRTLEPFEDDYIEFEKIDLADTFDKLGNNDDVTEKEFDDLMDRLMIWGGDGKIRKICWIRIA